MTLLEAENPVAAVRVAHALAFDAGDVDALVAVAESYATLGLVVHEAECLISVFRSLNWSWLRFFARAAASYTSPGSARRL